MNWSYRRAVYGCNPEIICRFQAYLTVYLFSLQHFSMQVSKIQENKVNWIQTLNSLANLSAVSCQLVLLKCLCNKQCGPRSDCSSWSSLIWVHTVCLSAQD